MNELGPAYDPKAVESVWYARWRAAGYFRPDPDVRKAPYCIVLPPPNVTGRLHMGHALTATIEDCLVRWKRMSGFATAWLPGTDHAGIATQVMVERQLAEHGETREQVGREDFLRRTWLWKEQHGGIIDEQHAALGASLDWDRYRFTMDPESSRAVREAFCRLYEDGKIYRAYRLINWDWASQTALSDLEVQHREVEGQLWHIAYPIEGTHESLVVATTRPETMLGDTAVAVHPEDPRYRHLIGKHAVLPLSGRNIPVIADAILVDMAFGTGAVKVTPAHDFNDFETGLRHHLEVLCVLDRNGRLNANVPERFRGLSVAQARQAVVDALAAEGALVKVERHTLNLGYSQRTQVAVEPLPSDQWFVKVDKLAADALDAIRSGRTRIIPSHRTAEYVRWMENIHDWCISRQLWWGHRIPAWHCSSCGSITVARVDPSQCGHCGRTTIRQDDDVLDTWFSSGLWPLTTLGWPDREQDLARFYPTSLLETGYDILFFWVARMMMFGIYLRNDVPFRDVFLHSMVLGEDGQKMSKTRGNVVDPMDLIAQFGADSLRFYLCTMAGQELGIVFSRARVEGYRHFCNKLWNAARFVVMNLDGWDPRGFRNEVLDSGRYDRLDHVNAWMLSRVVELAGTVGGHLEDYRLDLAAHALYQFVWYELCDWYLELVKPMLREDGHGRYDTQGVLVTTLDMVLRLLHPIIPYITEDIWTRLPKLRDEPASVMIAEFPRRLSDGMFAGPLTHVETLDPAVPSIMHARADIELLQSVVTAARSLRSQFKLPPAQKIDLLVRTSNQDQHHSLVRVEKSVAHLARLSRMRVIDGGSALPPACGVEVVKGMEIVVPLEGLVDVASERARLDKDIAKLDKDVRTLESRLANTSFRARAPADVVAKDDARLLELRDDVAKLRATLARL